MKKITAFLSLLVIATIQAQTFSGTLFMRDKSNFYLNQIYVTNLNEQKTYLSNYNGEFSLPVKEGDVVRFTSIVSERKDVKITKQLLGNQHNIIELEVAYKEIQEIILSRFKPTGNLRKDVRSLDSKKSALEIAKIVGLPAPKGNGQPLVPPIASLANGGLSLSLDGIFDAISGDAKKKKRLYEYEKMEISINNIKNYLGEDYFVRLKVPKNLIDNFLQFVYTSDNLYRYTEVSNYELAKVSIEKYLPIYQKRLRNSNLQSVIVNNY